MDFDLLNKIFKTDQIREIDSYTMENEPISSIDLMERAAKSIYSWLVDNFHKATPVKVFVGNGNNGGDGLAVARMLADKGFTVIVYLIKFSEKVSDNYNINLSRLENQNKVGIKEIRNEKDFPELEKVDLILDAIFGSGLTRPLSGFLCKN